MKELIKTRVIKEIVGYEADDGKVFDNKEDCEEYEKQNTKKLIERKFLGLIVAMFDEGNFTDMGNADFVGCGVGECCGIAVIKMENEDDLCTAKLFQDIYHPKAKRRFTEDMIGKEILVYVSGDYFEEKQENGKWTFDSCYPYGTVEDCVETYKQRLLTAIEYNRWDE